MYAPVRVCVQMARVRVRRNVEDYKQGVKKRTFSEKGVCILSCTVVVVVRMDRMVGNKK